MATKAPIDLELSEETKRLLAAIKKHAGSISLLNALRAIGISYRKEVKGIFERKQVRDPSLKWPELSPSTIKQKEALGYGDQPMMVRTGKLKKSMTQQGAEGNIAKYGHVNAEFGTKIEYGVYHDNLEEPRTKIPLRNFSQPSVSTYGSWIQSIQADLRNQLKAIGVNL